MVERSGVLKKITNNIYLDPESYSMVGAVFAKKLNEASARWELEK
jgi:hypothetical protein